MRKIKKQLLKMKKGNFNFVLKKHHHQDKLKQ